MALAALGAALPAAPAPLVYVSNSLSGQVSVVDVESGRVVAEIAAGREPFGIAFSPGGRRAYVACAQSHEVAVIDAVARTLVGRIPTGSELPVWVAMSPDGSYLYVTGERSNDVAVIATAGGAVVGRIRVVRNPAGIVVSPDGLRAYVANEGSNDVAVLDLRSEQVVETIAVGSVPQGLALSPVGESLYVANFGSGTVTVISTATRRVVAEVAVDSLAAAAASGPVGIAASADGRRVYTANTQSGALSVIDVMSRRAMARVSVGQSAFDVAVDRSDKAAYVLNGKEGRLSVVDVGALRVSRAIELRPGTYRLGIRPDAIGGPGSLAAFFAGLLGGLAALLWILVRAPAASPTRAPVLGALILALALRLFGLDWGLPVYDRETAQAAPDLRVSFHLDEDNFLWTLARAAADPSDPRGLDLHWGTLQHRLIQGVLWACERVGVVTTPWRESFLSFHPTEYPRLFVAARAISALLGSGSVLVVYAIGKRLYGRSAGAWSAIALAVMPLHVANSHYLTPDVTMSFFVLLCLLGLLVSLDHERGGAWLATGTAAGLAIAAKYNAVCLVPVLLLAHFLLGRRGASRLLWLSVGIAAGFLVGEPQVLSRAGELWTVLGRDYSSTRAMAGRGLGAWCGLLAGQARNALVFGLGIPFGLVLAVAGVRALRRPRAWRAGEIVLLAAVAIFAVSSALIGEPMIRYTLPAVVLCGLPLGAALGGLASSRPGRWLAALAVLATCFSSAAVAKVFGEEHTVNRAFQWVERHVAPGASVTKGWPELPVLNPGRYRLRNVFTLPRMASCDDFLTDDKGQAFRSDYLVLDDLPTFDCGPSFLRVLDVAYVRVAEFREDPELFGIVIPERESPHDWKYSHPVIRIYRRRMGVLAVP